MHRDLKGANLLVNNRGELKITDFGLARPIEENRLKYTPGVVTRWYRPPELLFGSDIYNDSIDIWGAGCIIAEMYIRKPLFGASSDLEQLKIVCMYCGTPSEESYPGVSELPDFSKVQLKAEKRILKEYLESKKLDKMAVDLIDKMLVMDPKQRLTAQQALEHEYFKCEPLPCLPSDIGKFESSHVYTVQQQKEKDQQQQIQKETKKSKIENERHYEGKDKRRGHHYNDHDSRYLEINYHRNEDLRYGDHLRPPPPPPPPPISTLRDRQPSSREEIGKEGGHHHDINRRHDDRKNHDSPVKYSGSYNRHYYDDQMRNQEDHRYYHHKEEEQGTNRRVENNESRSKIHRISPHADYEDVGDIGSVGERRVFNSSGSRSRSRSSERQKLNEAPSTTSNGAERSRRAISYDDL